jgi:hypothetical protein
MARFSQQMLKGLLNPAYQQELGQVGRAIGGAPRRMLEQRATQRSQAEIQELLQQHANNPAKLQQLANEYRAKGNTDAAQAFTTAATQATAKETAGQQRGIQGGLTAITQAAARGVPLQSDKKPDLRSAVSSVLAQGGTQADIMSAYNAGVAMSKGPQRQTANVSPGGAIVDEQTGEVIYERPFKKEAEKTPSVKIQVVEDELFVFEGTDLVNRIETEGDAEEEAGARNYVINSTMQTLSTVREAKKLLNETYFGVDPGGVSGSITSMISGSPSHELMTSSYVTIAGREALDEINRMKQEAAKYGSRGTGLGQVTQIEFSALQGNLAKLNTGLTVERQRELLNKIEEKLVATRRIASGENPIDVINFNDATYIEAGYIKEGGEVYYFAPGGKEFIYDRNKEAFIPYGG